MPNNHSETEKRLWDAADELRANSNLKSSEYSIPVLGLIFLRFADQKFVEAQKKLEGKGSGRRKMGKADYQAQGVLYLPDAARFFSLLNLPEGTDIGKAVNEAMKAIEAENEDLKDVLPRTYHRLEKSTLFTLLKAFNSIPMDVEGDVFGKIYEYFLGNFAMKEGQKGGEFFTPTAIVKLIVEIIEPYHGRIFDPACGSGGMFVQSARFVQNHKKHPTDEISIYGQERVAETIRLCKMNLAVHGLSGDIRQANTYYEDIHKSVGKFDFVMANPPFNVDSVDKEKIKSDPRFPLGLPKSDNANYLWIQIFNSALNKTGRAGFVMHNSAADAEIEIRKRLIEQDNSVDVVITTAANLFYTVSLPCSLWFLDKARHKSSRADSILFIDATSTYRQIDTVHRELTDEQIATLAGIVRSYRQEAGAEKYSDIPGLCKKIKISDLKELSLNPKIYVDHSALTIETSGDAQPILKEIAELNASIDSVRSTLAERLGLSDLPLDRGVLFDMAKLAYRKWFLQNELPQWLVAEVGGKPSETSGWAKKPLRELVEEYIGGTWGEEQLDGAYSEHVRVIRGTDLADVNAGELAAAPLRYIKASQLNSRGLKNDDIIIEVSGGGKEQSTGRSAYITDVLLHTAGRRSVCASFCKQMRIDASKISPAEVFLHLQYLDDEKLLHRYEVQSTGIKNFKFEYFLDTENILVPPPRVSELFQSTVGELLRVIHLIGAVREKTMLLVRSSSIQSKTN